MRINYEGKSYNTKNLKKYLDYLNEFVKQTNITGYFESISIKNSNIKNVDINIKKNYIRLYRALVSLRVLTQGTMYSHEPFNDPTKSPREFTICKPLFLAWHYLITYLESLSSGKRRMMTLHHYQVDVTRIINTEILTGIKERGIIKKHYEYTLFMGDINAKYKLKYEIALLNGIALILNKYLSHYALRTTYTGLWPNITFACDREETDNFNQSLNIINDDEYLKYLTFRKCKQCVTSERTTYIIRSHKTIHYLDSMPSSWFSNRRISSSFNSEQELSNLMTNDDTYTFQSTRYFSHLSEKGDFILLYPIYLQSKSELSDLKLSIIKSDFSHLIIRKSHVIKTLFEEMVITRSYNQEVLINLNIKTSRIKDKGYHLYVSCRQYNYFTQLNWLRRPIELQQFGFDEEYDLHSAIFTISKVIVSGEFNKNWDIKKELSSLSFKDIDGKPLDKNLFKNLGFRVFFAPSKEKSYSWYKNALKNRNSIRLDLVSEQTYSDIYDAFWRLTGAKEKQEMMNLRYVIFILESIFELRVINELCKRGIEYRNVYDCFYYKSNQISELELDEIVKEKMDSMYRDFHYLSKIDVRVKSPLHFDDSLVVEDAYENSF